MKEISLTPEIFKFAEQVGNLYRQAIIDSGTTATGNLQSFPVAVNLYDYHLVISFDLDAYWKYVEYGTKPHFPPIRAIEDWIRIKKIIPNSRNGKIPNTKQLAFAIAKSISKKGTKGKKLLTKTLKSREMGDVIKNLKSELIHQIKLQIYDLLK